MKKILIGIILCSLLVWCSQKDEVPNENVVNTEATQVKQELETQEEVKWEEQEIEERYSSGIVLKKCVKRRKRYVWWYYREFLKNRNSFFSKESS